MKSEFKLGKHQEAWLAALESGKYKKGTGRLRDGRKNKYCCLGVACEISGLGEWDDVNDVYLNSSGLLPAKVQRRLGLRGNNGRIALGSDLNLEYFDMVSMNDNLKMSFKRMAKIVRKNPGAFFTRSA